MARRLLRVTGSVLVVAVAFVTPILATTSTPASAQTVINGCTIVSNPTPSNFTNCPGVDLSNASLSGLDLSYANLSGASFAACTFDTSNMTADCVDTDLSGANLTSANLSGATFWACEELPLPVGCTGATLNDANLSAANLSNASLAGCYGPLCPSVNLTGATLTGANLTDVACMTSDGPCLVPTENIFEMTSGTGAVVAWSSSLQAIPGATPGTCTPASGSTFPLGATTVSCQVLDDQGDVATGTFTVAVCSPTSSCDLEGANLTGANFGSANLTDANLSGANLTGANFDSANLTDANLSGANLTEANFANTTTAGFPATNLTDANLAEANLTEANLGGAILSGASFTAATLTDADFTGTVLVPSNQSVAQTSQAGAVVTWSMPPALPGATPGSCTPSSGSTFPLGFTTVTCQVLDANNDIATGQVEIAVVPVPQIVLPSNGATLSGLTYLDAVESDSGNASLNAASVVYELSGGTLSDQVVATGTATLYGWLAQWNTRTVPNGIYTLQSVATDLRGFSTTSAPISVTVNNPPPTTAVVVPSGGATLSGASAVLDATASSAAGIASVTFEVSGNGLTNQVVATGTLTLYGYLAQWNTTAVPNGTYTLQSVATDNEAQTAASAPVTMTVDNPPPTTSVLIPSNGASVSGTSSLLDANSSANVTSVTYELSGGTLSGDQVIATGTRTLYGWLATWNTTSVPDGTYTLQSLASYAGGVTGTSAGITITVAN